MKQLYSFQILFVIFFFSIPNLALASAPDGISLTKSSQGYHIDFTLPGYQFEQVTAEGKEYLRLNIPEYGVIPNAPDFPHFQLFLSIFLFLIQKISRGLK